MFRIATSAILLASASPLLAEVHTIAPGDGAQERLQEALILAERLAAAGRHKEAAEAYREALAFAPGRRLSMEGLARAQAASR